MKGRKGFKFEVICNKLLYLAETNYNYMRPDSNEPVIILLDKLKLVMMLFGAALFAAAGMWFVVNPPALSVIP